MATFIGTSKEFHKYIGPMIRNHICTITKKIKKERNYICEHCGEKQELEAAHIKSKERQTIINNILNKYLTDEIITVNIQDIIIEIMNEHNPIETCFKFLCYKCHCSYDKV